MNPERFRLIEELFQRALEVPVEQRAELLARESRGDVELVRQVERLLHGDARAVAGIERLQLFEGSDDPPDRPDPLVDHLLGPWRILERLAEGGMGVMYRAERADGLFEQEVAVKVLRVEAASGEALRRFELERRLLARLEHPHIARILDGGRGALGTPYLVMEFVDGLPIDRWCEARQLALHARLRLFAVVCRAVHFAHRNLVVHRDLKPSNVMVDRHGAPKLLDFGIARLLTDDDGPATLAGARPFTPQYASPEQLMGQPLTTATDVYSLGVVLYELLTGRKPWRRTGHTPAEWERIVTQDEPARPSTAVQSRSKEESQSATAFAAGLRTTPGRLHRWLRGDLDRIVLMALRKEPERRYSSAEQIAEDIERYLGGLPVRARRDTVAYRAQRFVQRHRIIVGAAALVLLTLCGATYASLRARFRAEDALELARAEEARALAVAEHARIETESFQLIASFLGDTLLLGVDEGRLRENAGEAVAQQADLVRRLYGDEPHLCANLLDALGQVDLQLGLLDTAGALMEEARAIRLATFGERSMEHALSLGSLGRLAYVQGAFGRAAELLSLALELHRALPVDVHTDVPLALNDLAAAQRNLGRLDVAAELHAEALALRRRSAPEGSLAVAESANNLALVRLDQGLPEDARALADEALVLRERLLGADHALTLQARISLSGVEWRLERFDAAEEHLRAAIEGYRALGEAGQSALLRALASLSALEIRRGRLQEAMVSAEEAHVGSRARYGPDHPHTAGALAHLAAIHARRGEHGAAREAWLEVLRVRRAAYPAGHLLLVQTLHHLAIALVQGGDPAEAEPYLREAAAMLEGIPDSAALVGERASLDLTMGANALALKRPEEARTHLERARDAFTRFAGPDSAGAESARRYLAGLVD